MTQERKQRVEEALQTLQPVTLRILDESDQHIGHAGAATGLSHYAIDITSPLFTDLSPIKRHQLIYEALGDLMSTDIHALRVINATPSANQQELPDES